MGNAKRNKEKLTAAMVALGMKSTLETIVEQIEIHLIFCDPDDIDFLSKLNEDLQNTLTNYENRYKKKKKK